MNHRNSEYTHSLFLLIGKYGNIGTIAFFYGAVASVVWWGEISGVGRGPVASCRLWKLLPGYKNLGPHLVVAI